MSKNAPRALLPQRVSWRPMLLATPRHNQVVEVETLAEEIIRLSAPTVPPKWFIWPLTWMMRPRFRRTARLDDVGTTIWYLCDGSRTVEDVIEAVAQKYALSFHEARVSVTQYIKVLVARGFLVMEL